jgi:adenylosuccinate lyase
MKNQQSSNNSYGIGEAITPIDGRNRHKLQNLIPYFSEMALCKYRIFIEIQYLFKLSEYKIIEISKKEVQSIELLYSKFNTKEYQQIKVIENKINHDVKAIEYYLREKFIKTSLKKLIPFIHIGLTSEDTNNLAYGLILKDFKKDILEKQLSDLLKQIKDLSIKYNDSVFLGRTHGQPAVPTTVGKEFANYYFRLQKQFIKLQNYKFEGKCNGAVGNNNAMQFVYPNIDWIKFSQKFVSSLGLVNNIFTTQILFYDNWIEFFQTIQLINGILIDLSINMWEYIMLEIFVQKKDENQVGSSTMPQKINPINFEHAEGSLQFANSMFEMYQRKLLTSRLQRDLSDSTVRRTFGEAFGHTVLAWESIKNGLQKISVNEKHIKDELNNHWEVLSEAIQTYLRSIQDEKAYEKLKKLTQGRQITKNNFLDILKALKLDKNKKLIKLSPEKYVGYAIELVDQCVKTR